ncbi:helix-turn-helix transcriptional regulator [Vagococcus fluvialis]|uniref:helix-turn-helix domain-containing protein n=1 Tax=Vagococcus fluvialis TaxID=2738 RepID=UPI0014330A20|nr:helix-turn-helix transcriptional regulator [Vagococcus fluvialis]NKC58975.1 helix-turn-helix transcriptional regulator [Vagococcus fluvialis]NKD49730.1 helix-turn-helix transcriptional regulator [Vagococcus fluvialis]
MLKFRLKEIMDERNITISELAKQTTVSRPSISAIYNGTSRSVNIDILEKIMNYLNVELTDLIIDEKTEFTISYRSESNLDIYLKIESSIQSKELFEGIVNFVPGQSILDLTARLNNIENNLKESNRTQENLLLFLADYNNHIASKVTSKEFEKQNDLLNNTLMELGNTNSHTLIRTLLTDCYNFHGDSSEDEILIVRTSKSKMYMFLMNKDSISDFLFSNSETDENNAFIKFIYLD